MIGRLRELRTARGPAAHRFPCDRNVVLDRKRHAGQRHRRPIGMGIEPLGLGQGSLVTDDPECAQARVPFGNACQRLLGGRAGGQLTAAHRLGRFGRRHPHPRIIARVLLGVDQGG
jgi:hypothetical protein